MPSAALAPAPKHTESGPAGGVIWNFSDGESQIFDGVKRKISGRKTLVELFLFM